MAMYAASHYRIMIDIGCRPPGTAVVAIGTVIAAQNMARRFVAGFDIAVTAVTAAALP